MTDGLEPSQAKGMTRRDILVRVFGLALVALVLWLLFTRLVSWSDVVDAMSGLGFVDWALLVLVAAVRIAIEPLLLMATTPRLPWRLALGCSC